MSDFRTPSYGTVSALLKVELCRMNRSAVNAPNLDLADDPDHGKYFKICSVLSNAEFNSLKCDSEFQHRDQPLLMLRLDRLRSRIVLSIDLVQSVGDVLNV